LEGLRGKEFIELVGFIGFIGLKEREHVQGSILNAVGNTINTTNTRNLINKTAGWADSSVPASKHTSIPACKGSRFEDGVPLVANCKPFTAGHLWVAVY
jgi:hypothetical protein